MKRFFSLLFLSIIVGNIYSQNLSFGDNEYADANDRTVGFTFYDGFRVKGYKNGNSQGGYHTGSYTIAEEHGINYLIILWDDKTWDKYLMIARINLKNKNIYDPYFYNADGEPFFSCGTFLNPEYITFFPFIISTDILSASSSLREGSKVFSTDNLISRIGVCWAEGVRGHGIGEKIIFKNNGNLFFDLSISIGYVSFEKPYLYRENSRPKKLRISFEGEEPKIIELADTPNLQYLGDIRTDGKKDLWVEILEVYPGTKYTDTCINFFQGFYSQ